MEPITYSSLLSAQAITKPNTHNLWTEATHFYIFIIENSISPTISLPEVLPLANVGNSANY